MQKISSKIKNHAQIIRTHIKDNTGDGYVWFLMMTTVLLLVFGALFTIMQTAVNMRDIRNDVDEAAMDAFAEIREIAYDRFTDGATDFTNTDEVFAQITDKYIMEMMSKHLTAEFEGGGLHPYIYKNDARNNLAYKIENLEFEYIDQINSYVTNQKVGDVNKDGTVDSTDINLLEHYLNGDIPDGVTLADVDINKDYSATKKDLLLLEGLVDYFATHPAASLESADHRSSALLMITFQVTVPIDFGTVDFGDSVDSYSYYSILSFKPAM